MKSLIERLRAHRSSDYACQDCYGSIQDEAADAIEQLRGIVLAYWANALECDRPWDADRAEEVLQLLDEPLPERPTPEPCSNAAKAQGCSCRIPIARSTDLEPPEPRIDKWGPVHGCDPDYKLQKQRDDAHDRHNI